VILRSCHFADLDTRTLYAILRLRCDVFVVEQQSPYPDVDGRDTEPATVHLWLEDDGVIIAYLRVLRDPSEFRIGRVCTARAHRGTGLAARLMQAALDTVDGERAACVLDAQMEATRLYERFGFKVSGDRFLDGGIEHVPMRRGQAAASSSASWSAGPDRPHGRGLADHEAHRLPDRA
jgi:ElaA protein